MKEKLALWIINLIRPHIETIIRERVHQLLHDSNYIAHLKDTVLAHFDIGHNAPQKSTDSKVSSPYSSAVIKLAADLFHNDFNSKEKNND